MSLSVTRNIPVQLTAVLGDGKIDQFLTAYITNSAGTEVAVVPLAHIGRGKYEAVWPATFTGYASATYIAYLDAARLTANPDYDLSEDKFFIVERDVVIEPTVPSGMIVPAAAPNLTYVLGLSTKTSQGAEVIPDSTPIVSVYDTTGAPLVLRAAMTANGTVLGTYLYNFVVTPTMLKGSVRVEFETVFGGAVGTSVVTSVLSSANDSLLVKIDIPDAMYSHATATNQYPFLLNAASADNTPITPDATPTVRILDVTGTVIVLETPMLVLLARVGAYAYTYAVPPGQVGERPLIVEFKVIFGGRTSYTHIETQTLSAASGVLTSGDAQLIADAVWDEVIPGAHDILDSAGAIAQITNLNTENTDTYITSDPDFSLEAIKDAVTTGDAATLAQVVIVEGKVDTLTAQEATNTADIITEVQALTAMETNLDLAITASTNTLTTEINANEAILTTQIKPQTDLIIANPATALDIAGLDAKLDLKLETTDFNTSQAAQITQIEGADSRDLTEVFDAQRGTDNALLSTDPRLDNLDARVSTRSVVTDASVWTYASRTLTAAVAVNPASVWDYLVAAVTTAGSMGKLIVDNLDVRVSTRSTLTAADLTAAMALTAQETTLVSARDQILTSVGLTDGHVIDNKNILNLIKPRTDLIVAGGATEANVDAEAAATNVLIGTLQTTVNNVKVKTDNIPPNPAVETSVQAIPLNPLLTNDPRLNNLNSLVYLDMYISDVGTLFPTDYSKEATLNTASAQILADIAVVDAHVLVLPTTAYFNPQFVKSDSILIGLDEIKGVGFTTTDTLVSIKAAIPASATMAADVWAQPARTLTSYPAFATPTDVTNAANSTVASLTQYYCGMSTAIDTNTAVQKLICWLVINSRIVLATTNAEISIDTPDTGNVWTGTIATSDAAGIFSTTINAAGFYTAGLNYTATIKITSGADTYTTVQPFVAVV